jgi:hypothetical protein
MFKRQCSSYMECEDHRKSSQLLGGLGVVLATRKRNSRICFSTGRDDSVYMRKYLMQEGDR